MQNDKPTVGIVIGSGAEQLRELTGAGDAVVRHPPKAMPLIREKYGRAWLCNIDEGRRRLGLTTEQDATVARWIVEAPWAHPAWSSYGITQIHLRPMPDGRPTKFYLPDATHEIWVAALNPDVEIDPVIETGINLPCLRPGNFAAQFIEIEDRWAIERVEKAVREIVEGKLSPDSDHARCCWAKRFGSNMLKA